jgi:hypothetical protein
VLAKKEKEAEIFSKQEETEALKQKPQVQIEN